MKEIEEVALKLIECLERGDNAAVQEYFSRTDSATAVFLLMTAVSLLAQRGRLDLIMSLRGVMMAVYFSTGSGQWRKLESKYDGQYCLFCQGALRRGMSIYWRKMNVLEKYTTRVDEVDEGPPQKSLVAHVNCFLMNVPVATMTDDMLREGVEVLRERNQYLQNYNELLFEKLQESAKWASSAVRSSSMR